MSDPSRAADVQQQVNWNTYVELISFTILYYDYVLTFDMEVERFWLRPGWSPSAILFYLNRYLTLLGNVPNLLFSFWTGPFPTPDLTTRWTRRCHSLEIYHQFLIAVVQLVISSGFVLLILRAHVLYNSNRVVLIVLSLTAVAMVANGFAQWAMIGTDSPNPAPSVDVGCLQNFAPGQGIHIIALWLGVTVLDLMVFVLILRRTLALQRDCPSGLWRVIMRDGVMYFGSEDSFGYKDCPADV
ncbi:hypothetical protein V5O48_008903 [Marasmius crinis-equi]|uniref:DUF6533 domain-containing protein n=1 Tax=Marasmius crinis-equi TaxID=585013 RepID=A0ABR3FCM8_9AGAR